MSGRVNREETIAPDPMNKAQRSAQMGKVRSQGNQSTEGQAELMLINAGIQGWEKHPKMVLGKPDFFFPEYKLAVFVDGCFWHGCPVCKRRTPKSDFWRKKLEENLKRDNRVHRQLRKDGYHVMRVWEHELKKGLWLKRLRAMIRRIGTTSV
jgi:DNA mismatch endonuclease (patch repair protein)